MLLRWFLRTVAIFWLLICGLRWMVFVWLFDTMLESSMIVSSSDSAGRHFDRWMVLESKSGFKWIFFIWEKCSAIPANEQFNYHLLLAWTSPTVNCPRARKTTCHLPMQRYFRHKSNAAQHCRMTTIAETCCCCRYRMFAMLTVSSCCSAEAVWLWAKCRDIFSPRVCALLAFCCSWDMSRSWRCCYCCHDDVVVAAVVELFDVSRSFARQLQAVVRHNASSTRTNRHSCPQTPSSSRPSMSDQVDDCYLSVAMTIASIDPMIRQQLTM